MVECREKTETMLRELESHRRVREESQAEGSQAEGSQAEGSQAEGSRESLMLPSEKMDVDEEDGATQPSAPVVSSEGAVKAPAEKIVTGEAMEIDTASGADKHVGPSIKASGKVKGMVQHMEGLQLRPKEQPSGKFGPTPPPTPATTRVREEADLKKQSEQQAPTPPDTPSTVRTQDIVELVKLTPVLEEEEEELEEDEVM
ncbi:hypothetical protein LTR85_004443 [Meristemomyces frigidus]|nr:hypothetical protein LTR85_004443 [Meristemomyces frigidus]